jgi:hypothetical protein
MRVFEIHGRSSYVTPLPEKEKPAYIQELIDDAIQKVLVQRWSTCLIYLPCGFISNQQGDACLS